jgi:hypothetical protein
VANTKSFHFGGSSQTLCLQLHRMAPTQHRLKMAKRSSMPRWRHHGENEGSTCRQRTKETARIPSNRAKLDTRTYRTEFIEQYSTKTSKSNGHQYQENLGNGAMRTAYPVGWSWMNVQKKSKLSCKRTQQSMVRNMSQRIHRARAGAVLMRKNRKRQNEIIVSNADVTWRDHYLTQTHQVDHTIRNPSVRGLH